MRDAVVLETHLAVDLPPTDERVLATAEIQQRLETALSVGLRRRGGQAWRSGLIPTVLQQTVIKEIDRIGVDLLLQARRGFEDLATSPAQFWVNTVNAGNPERFEQFDFSDLPFIRFHGEALDAAMHLRQHRWRHQRGAMRLAYLWMEIESLEEVEGIEGERAEREAVISSERLQLVRMRRDMLSADLPPDVQHEAKQFYDCMQVGGLYPYAMPIEVGASVLRVGDLNFLADAYRRFGESLLIPFDLRLGGSDEVVAFAMDARLRYESAGVGFQILSAWVKSLGILQGAPKCDVCYRHASAVSRCSVHATKTHETAEARLGFRIRPSYQDVLVSYAAKRSVKRLIREGLPWTEHADPELLRAAARTGLASAMQRRAIVLANQLRALVLSMNAEMQAAAERLFAEVLSAVARLDRMPPPVSLQERRIRDQQFQEAKELLSIRGYFRAWCGPGWYSANTSLRMLEFDRDHPVVLQHPVTGGDVAWSLVRQRAWLEATAAFVARTAPTAADVRRLLDEGLSKKAVAERLGLALSTVYKILRRGDASRRRQYLGRQASSVMQTVDS